VASPASSQDDPAWPDDAVEVGRIMDAWGLKGWVKVQPFAEDAQALFSSRRWFLKPPLQQGLVRPAATQLSAPTIPQVLRVTSAKDHGEMVVAQVQGVDDRSGAEALRGARVFVPRASFPTAGEGEYYWIDLIGLDVVNREGHAMGRVIGLLDTGPHSVLRIAPPGLEVVAESAERLIPFVAAFVDDVSLPERRITVDWGLDY